MIKKILDSVPIDLRVLTYSNAINSDILLTGWGILLLTPTYDIIYFSVNSRYHCITEKTKI